MVRVNSMVMEGNKVLIIGVSIHKNGFFRANGHALAALLANGNAVWVELQFPLAVYFQKMTGADLHAGFAGIAMVGIDFVTHGNGINLLKDTEPEGNFLEEKG